MSYYLRPHGLQQTRPPCPSPTPGVYSDSCPLSWWCHPIISSSIVLFSSHFHSFPASGSFHMSQPFASGDQSIGASASVSVPSNEYSGLISVRMDWLDLLAVGTARESSPTLQFKSINSLALIFIVKLSHPYMTTGKTIALTRQTIVGKGMCLLFILLS